MKVVDSSSSDTFNCEQMPAETEVLAKHKLLGSLLDYAILWSVLYGAQNRWSYGPLWL